MSMISNQVKALRSAAQAAKIEGHEMYTNHLKAAADTIEELAEKIHALNMERSAAHYNGGWIPCSERLPEEEGDYLCINKEGIFMVGMPRPSVTRGHYWVRRYSQIMFDVIAWMPMPEPYKEDKR